MVVLGLDLGLSGIVGLVVSKGGEGIVDSPCAWDELKADALVVGLIVTILMDS